MRRLPSVLILGALALSTLAFSSPVEPGDEASERQTAICVKFRDWTVPGTGITFEKPSERFCVEVDHAAAQQ